MATPITVQQLRQHLHEGQSIQVIDVRSPGEYAAGHVPRATNIPLEQVEARLGDIGPGPVAVICQSGRRASMACETLAQIHSDLLLVEGGTSAWQGAGFPVVAMSGGRWSLERQVRFVAGLMVFVGALLGLTVTPGWTFLALFVGFGLAFAGLTNTCGLAFLLAKLPWNRPVVCQAPNRAEARS